jgi:hypothetical protein
VAVVTAVVAAQKEDLHQPIENQKKKYPARVVKLPVAAVAKAKAEIKAEAKAVKLSLVFIKTPGIFQAFLLVCSIGK